MRSSSIFQIAALTVGAILLIVLVVNYNFSAAVTAFSRLKLFYIVLATLSFLAYTFLRFLPWAFIIRQSSIKMGFLRSFLMMQAYFDMSVISFLFQFVSLRYLDRFKKNARLFSGSIIISTGLTSFFALILMVMLTSVLISVYIPYIIALAAIFYLFMSLIGREGLLRLIVGKLRKFNSKFKSAIIRTSLRYLNVLRKTRSFLSQRDILIETLAFLPALFFENLIIYFTLIAFNQNISIFSVIFFFSIADIIGIISFLPLAIGALDISFVGFLTGLGVPGIIALSTLLIYRFFMNLILPILGYSCLMSLDFLTRKNLLDINNK